MSGNKKHLKDRVEKPAGTTTPEFRRDLGEFANQMKERATERPGTLNDELLARISAVSAWVQQQTESANGRGWMRLLESLRGLAADQIIASSPGASDFLDLMIAIASDSIFARDADQAVAPLDGLMPLGERGKKFANGRKIGTIGPVRTKVQQYLKKQYLKKQPTASAKDVWDGLKSKPPKGWQFFENRSGRYIETDSASGGIKQTSFGRFANVVSEERRKMKM